MKKILLVLFSILLISCSDGKQQMIREALTASQARYAVFISKKSFRLEVYGRDFKPAASYKAGYGKNPDRKKKLFEGDNRTPEGVYRVSGILSMDADRSTASYKQLAAMNKTYFRAKEGHSKFGKPSEDLGDNAYGPRFFALDYPNSEDKVRYDKAVKDGLIPMSKGKVPGIGFGIAIHGNSDPDGVGQLASSGCVRLFNSDLIELEKYIELGTPVIISSEYD